MKNTITIQRKIFASVKAMMMRLFKDKHASERALVPNEKGRNREVEFKDKVRKGSNRKTTERSGRKEASMVETLGQLNEFLAGHYSLRYNLMTGQTECAQAGTDRYVVVDQRMLNTISLTAMNAGIACWDRDVRRAVESDVVEAYHPFKLYFCSLPEWDGRDRVTPLARRVSDEPVWVNGFHRWMLGMTAQWTELYTVGQSNSVAPILVSTVQGWGKSTFCRMLMPDALRRYFTESYDLTAPSAAEARLAMFGLINIDEFDRLSATRMPLLKNLMQMQRLNVRRAYRRSTEPLSRIASFIGTSNRRDLLTDRTGSRRFICVELKHAIRNSTVEHKQLYAQLLHELRQGERCWLNKQEEADIQTHNMAFYRTSPAEDVFNACFRFATDDEIRCQTCLDAGRPAAVTGQSDLRRPLLLTATEIYTELQRRNPAAMRGTTCQSFSRFIPSLGKRVHTRNCNGYYVFRL